MYSVTCVKIKITHSIAPVNLQSSINVTGMSRCPNVCPIVLFRSTYFINITTVSNSTISSSNFNKILLSGVDINIQQAYKILLKNSQLTGKNWRKRGEFQTHTAVRWLHALTHSHVITQESHPAATWSLPSFHTPWYWSCNTATAGLSISWAGRYCWGDLHAWSFQWPPFVD